MYHHLSRLLYRELAPLLRDNPRQGGMNRQRQRLLDACETTMKRLVTDPDYFAHPARFLFAEVRPLVGLCEQRQVRRIVDSQLALARRAIDGNRALLRRDCAAYTRSGASCRREPVAGSRYCPSHRHLEELLDAPAEIAA